MKEISIFVDESGDFGPYAIHSPYYIVAFIVHNQTNDISVELENFQNRLVLGFEKIIRNF